MCSHVSYPEAVSSSNKNHYLKGADAKVTSALFNEDILCRMCIKGKQNMEGTSDWPFFFNLCGGTLGSAATTGLLYQPRMIGDSDWGEIGGMKTEDEDWQGKPNPIDR
jgi:hypothetical protein